MSKRDSTLSDMSQRTSLQVEPVKEGSSACDESVIEGSSAKDLLCRITTDNCVE